MHPTSNLAYLPELRSLGQNVVVIRRNNERPWLPEALGYLLHKHNISHQINGDNVRIWRVPDGSLDGISDPPEDFGINTDVVTGIHYGIIYDLPIIRQCLDCLGEKNRSNEWGYELLQENDATILVITRAPVYIMCPLSMIVFPNAGFISDKSLDESHELVGTFRPPMLIRLPHRTYRVEGE